jgi:DNA-directed RNA polymerase subunit M
MVCSSCDARQTKESDLSERYRSTEEQTFDDVIESDPEAADEAKPTATVRCDDCGRKKAWYVIKQTGSADEPPTRFFKCTECGHRWRGYS